MGNTDNMEDTLERLLERLLRPIAGAPNPNARLLAPAPLARRIRSKARSRRTRHSSLLVSRRRRMVGARHRRLRSMAQRWSILALRLVSHQPCGGARN
jgi:hypothetical protein